MQEAEDTGEKRPLRALVVEDDADINETVAVTLERMGFSCTCAFSGSEARLVLAGELLRAPLDLVVCDLMLPGATGEELVAEVRSARPETAVVVISARGEVDVRVELLRLGADDYLVKPFDLDELSARVEALMRRMRARPAPGATTSTDGAGGASEEKDVLVAGAWELDCAGRALVAAGVPVPLTKTEFGIAELLARHPNRVFTRQELFEAVWGEPYSAADGTVGSHISNLRAKLRPSGTDGYVRTVWGIGFKLDVR